MGTNIDKTATRATRRHSHVTLLVACAVPLFAAGELHPPTAEEDCVDCHAAIVEHKALHAPVKEQMCGACHDIPAAGGAATLTEEPDTICGTCHEDEGAGEFVHGPVAVGACAVCHDPHGSEAAGLLREAEAATCFACHTEIEARVKSASFQHVALEMGCTECHSPHSSSERYLLKAGGTALCSSCHAEVVEQASSVAVKHSAVTKERACLNCHDPHVADGPLLLRTDGTATCLNCHDKEVTAGGVALADMGKLLAENRSYHGPIREKDCAGCHQPHGSANFRLLVEEYPKTFYAPFREENFALCFRCHDPAVVREERTTTLTDFRDGDRNLHYVHVNKALKGRTCRACHEVHASSLPNHIRETVPFGRWELPVNFSKTARGGTCAAGCHKPLSYDRGAPVQSSL